MDGLCPNRMSGDLTALVSRLESVTSRLEALASAGGGSVQEGECSLCRDFLLYSFVSSIHTYS